MTNLGAAITSLLEATESSLVASEIPAVALTPETVRGLLAAGEDGVAYEILCDNLYEADIAAARLLLTELHHAAQQSGADPSRMAPLLQSPSDVWTAGYVFTEPLRDLREAVGEAATLREELMREIGAGHVLHGVELHVIARATPQDDVIVQAADGQVALVHLTWRGQPETPPWPTTELVTSPEHLENLIEFRY